MNAWRETLDVALALADAARNSNEQEARGAEIAAQALDDFGYSGTLTAGAHIVLPVRLPVLGRYLLQLVQPAGCDFDLALFDAVGKPLAADASAHNPSAVSFAGAGLHFVAVVAHRGEGEFNLTLIRLS